MLCKARMSFTSVWHLLLIPLLSSLWGPSVEPGRCTFQSWMQCSISHDNWHKSQLQMDGFQPWAFACVTLIRLVLQSELSENHGYVDVWVHLLLWTVILTSFKKIVLCIVLLLCFVTYCLFLGPDSRESYYTPTACSAASGNITVVPSWARLFSCHLVSLYHLWPCTFHVFSRGHVMSPFMQVHKFSCIWTQVSSCSEGIKLYCLIMMRIGDISSNTGHPILNIFFLAQASGALQYKVGGRSKLDYWVFPACLMDACLTIPLCWCFCLFSRCPNQTNK